MSDLRTPPLGAQDLAAIRELRSQLDRALAELRAREEEGGADAATWRREAEALARRLKAIGSMATTALDLAGDPKGDGVVGILACIRDIATAR